MAKESMKAREVKRQKLVAKYAAKRKALKKAGDYEALQLIPKNASPVRLHNRCKLTGRPKGYMRTFGVDKLAANDIEAFAREVFTAAMDAAALLRERLDPGARNYEIGRASCRERV